MKMVMFPIHVVPKLNNIFSHISKQKYFNRRAIMKKSELEFFLYIIFVYRVKGSMCEKKKKT